jgi:predicted nucleic acid-binding Zn finger protein
MKEKIFNGLVNALIRALIVILKMKRGDEITGRLKDGKVRYYFLLSREDYMLGSKINVDEWIMQDLYDN